MYVQKLSFKSSSFVIGFYNAQEGVPVYSDYLSDNYYLIHLHGWCCNCAKVRLTARKQWFDKKTHQTANFKF